jgi:transcriptional regulator with XRE-family HTH domain
MARVNSIDVYVGARLRQRRTLLGMSQTKLGTAVGLTFQQIQKYERGANRIGSGRLFEFAELLDAPVSYFFDEMPAKTSGIRSGSAHSSEAAGVESETSIKREVLELVQAYYKIRVPRIRACVFELIKAVGAASYAEAPSGRE